MDMFVCGTWNDWGSDQGFITRAPNIDRGRNGKVYDVDLWLSSIAVWRFGI